MAKLNNRELVNIAPVINEEELSNLQEEVEVLPGEVE